MTKAKLKVGARYNTTDKRRVTLLEDHGEIVVRQVDGEDPQPMHRDKFEAWVTSESRTRKAQGRKRR